MARVVQVDVPAMMRVSRHVELRDVQFLACEAKRFAPADPSVLKLAFRDTWNSRFEALDMEDGTLTYVLRFDGWVMVSGESGETDRLASIGAELRTVYELGEEGSTDPKDLDEFGRSNVLSTTWPYWREYVSSCLARIGLPPFATPVLVLKPKPKKTSSSEEDQTSDDQRPQPD